MMTLRIRHIVVATLAAFGLWQAGCGIYIHAKAWLAQRLIASSWEQTLAGERHVRPWPWADMWPVARLRVPAAGVDLYVLADASGRSLAFGPGYLSGSATPGSVGNIIIAAHRDTHFEFLRATQVGEDILLQTSDRHEHHYRVVDTQVIDVSRDQLSTTADRPTLTLLTCYPFDAITPGGPLRFVAIAEATIGLSM